MNISYVLEEVYETLKKEPLMASAGTLNNRRAIIFSAKWGETFIPVDVLDNVELLLNNTLDKEQPTPKE